MENVLESLSPLSTAVHHDDFTSLGEHTSSHLTSDVEAALVGDEGEEDDSPVNGLVVPPSLTADDDDDPIARLAVPATPDPSQVLRGGDEVSGLVDTSAVVGEMDDGSEVVHAAALQQAAGVVALDNGQLIQAAEQEGLLLTTDADGNLALPVSTEHVIRFLMQTSDGNVVAANAPMEAIKLSLPGLLGGDVGDITQTVQAVTLPDGTTTLIATPTVKEDTEDQQVLPKFVEGQVIKLEDGSTAVLQATPPEALNEGLQAIQLEDGSTAFISQAHTESLFPGAVHQLDTSLHLDQLANQTMLVTAERQSEKALVIGDKAFKCLYEDCGRYYTTHHHLKVHERSHTGDRPFQCEFPNCGKTFATGYGLKSHNRVHTGEKPYPCPHTDKGCEKAFKTSGDLQKHVRTHTGERPFKCPFEGCTQSFTTSNIRKVHIRTHTGERPYICDVDGCGRAFASATNYKNHIRIHTGEKPYVCSVVGCGKRFTEYSSLYKHHVVHTHTKPYTCHCGKTYRQTSTLAMHKRTAHGEEGTILPGETDPEEPPPKRRMIKAEASDSGETSTSQQQQGGHLLVNSTDGSQMVLLTQSISPTAANATTTTATSTAANISGVTATTTASTPTPTPTTITRTDTEETTTTTNTATDDHSLLTHQKENDEDAQQQQQQLQQQQEQHQQNLSNLVSLQHSIANLTNLHGLQGLPSLAMAEGGQQVLVVTDPAQLEALQHLAQQFETFSQQPADVLQQGQDSTTSTQVALSVSSAGDEDVDIKPSLDIPESFIAT